jgi:hypothetical protein
MNFRWTTWGVGLLGVLALPGCSGDDTPTPDGREAGSVTTGAGGAGNDSGTGTGGSAGKSGGSATDSGGDSMICKATTAMAVTGQDLQACKAGLAEAGGDDGGDSGVASCLTCLCGTCPKEAMMCIGNPNCAAVNDCCRSRCKCPSATPEAGSDAPASETGDALSSSDATATE